MLACTTEIHYEGEVLASFRGAERLVTFRVERGLYISGCVPFRWTAPEPGPQLEKTGTW